MHYGAAWRWLRTLRLALAALPVQAGAARLDIEPTGIENDRGLVRVAVRTPETFATHYLYFGAMPAHVGRYAVQAYYDEDGNGRVRRGLFGVPAEAIGFSRDTPLRLGPPRFEDAAIEVTEPATATRLRLCHVGG